MRALKTLSALLILLFLLLAIQANTSYSQPKNGDEITIKGEVVDVNCLVHMNMKGQDHKQCAITCAKAGSPLAIETSDGVLYFPIVGEGKNPNDKLMDYVADNVEVKGKYYSNAGTKGIVISSVKKVE